MDTCHVVPNFCKTQIQKSQFKYCVFAWRLASEKMSLYATDFEFHKQSVLQCRGIQKRISKTVILK